MWLINCKVELKLTWTKYCVSSVAGADDVDSNVDDNVNGKNIFTIKDTKLYVPVVALTTRDNQKLSNRFSKGVERSVYWNEYKTIDYKNTTNEFRYFLKSNFVGVSRLFYFIQIKMLILKDLKLEDIIYWKA